MKAGIYLGKERIELRELPLPEVGEHDVLVKNLFSDICGRKVTDFTVGERFCPYPQYAKGDTRPASILGGFFEYILITNAKLHVLSA